MRQFIRQFSASVLEVIEVALIAFGAVVVIRAFLVQPFLVSGDSMVPSFSNKDYLLIDELTFRFREPERGEVIVFKYPKDPSTYFIKRIIGLPGDRVEIKDGRVVVANSQHPKGGTLGETYLASGNTTTIRPGGQSAFELQKGQYLVLGDNRSSSFDSRDWGILDRSHIVGLVRLRLWPPDGLTVFASPKYEY